MTTFVYSPVPADDLSRIRAAGVDDHGNALVTRSAGGGEPLRCCLRLAPSGDEIVLISYQPSAQGGPYAEIGPVFVHADDCGGPVSGDFPADYLERKAVLRPYDADGQMLDGVLVEPGEATSWLAKLFDDPQVALVHHRNVIAGCWNFTVTRS